MRRVVGATAVDDVDPEVATDLSGAGRFGGLSAAGLVAVVVGALPFLSLAALVVAEWTPLTRLDERIAQNLNDLLATADTSVRALSIVTELGGGATASVIMGIAALWLLVRRHHQLAAYVAVTGAGLAVLVVVSKELVGRARPEVALPVVHIPTNPSFPSGHAMTAIVTWGALALIALPVVRRSRRRWLVAATVALVVATGLTRIALGVHFLTDVIAGWALGGAWLAVTTIAFRSWLVHRHLPRGDSGLTEAPVRALHVRTLDERAVPEGRRTVTRIGATAAGVAVVVIALGLLSTALSSSGTGLARLDERGVDALLEARTATLTTVVERVDTLGGLWGVVIATIAVAALGTACRGSWRPAALVALAVGGEVLLYGLTSAVVGRDRPDVEDLYDSLPTAASFPSGHVAATVAVYGSLSALALAYGTGWWPRLVVAGTVLLVVAMMLGRVYIAAHYPSDVVGGALLGALWVWGLSALLLRPGSGAPRDHRWDTPLVAERRSGGTT